MKTTHERTENQWGVYDNDELIAIFFTEERAKGYENDLNWKMQTCRFETFKLDN